MNFVNNFKDGSKIIRKTFPEFANSHLAGDNSGWDNYAIIADDEYLFRFPRRQEALKQIQKETEVLNALRAKLPSYIEVPNYLAANLEQDYPFVYYKMIQGTPLTKDLYDSFNNEEKEKFTQNITDFLHILHSIDVKSCKSLEEINALDKYQSFYQQIRKICFKYLTPEKQNKTIKLFGNYFQDKSMRDYHPVVTHGDLSENHILITDNGIGIIDFGDTDIFDPAIDISWFYLFDKEAFQNIASKYFANDEEKNVEKRISEFYVPIIPYYGIIFGEETGNRTMIQDELKDLQNNLSAL